MKYINKISKNIVKNNIIPKSTRGGSVLEHVNKNTLNFFSRLRNSTPEVIEKFLNENATIIKTRDLNSQIYRCDDLVLIRSNGTTAYNIEQNISMLDSFSCTPKYLQYFQMGNNDFLSVLYCGENCVKAVDAKVPLEAKKDFKLKLLQLAKNGYVNQEIFANKESLLYNPQSKSIIATDWSNIAIVPKNELPNIKNAIRDFIL